MLHVGGVQEPVMAAPPTVAVANPLVLTLTEAGSEELQVSGTEVLDP